MISPVFPGSINVNTVFIWVEFVHGFPRHHLSGGVIRSSVVIAVVVSEPDPKVKAAWVVVQPIRSSLSSIVPDFLKDFLIRKMLFRFYLLIITWNAALYSLVFLGSQSFPPLCWQILWALCHVSWQKAKKSRVTPLVEMELVGLVLAFEIFKI